MRKYTIITAELRRLIPDLPEGAKFVAITNQRLTWDNDDYEYKNALLTHDYVDEGDFIERCKKLNLIAVEVEKQDDSTIVTCYRMSDGDTSLISEDLENILETLKTELQHDLIDKTYRFTKETFTRRELNDMSEFDGF